MTGTRRRTASVLVAALGIAVVLVWAAGVGPGGLVGSRQTNAPEVVPTAGATPTDTATEPVQPDQEDGLRRSPVGGPVSWVTDLVTIAAMLVSVWFAGVVLRRTVLAFRRRLPPTQLVLDLEPVPHLNAARESLRADRARLRGALAAGEVRNGIVACWVLLEEAAAEAGVARLPAETATEFVVRFLHSLDVDPAPVGTLAGLYHEARFSTHRLGEDTRRRASAALASVLADLDTASLRPGVAT